MHNVLLPVVAFVATTFDTIADATAAEIAVTVIVAVDVADMGCSKTSHCAIQHV